MKCFITLALMILNFTCIEELAFWKSSISKGQPGVFMKRI